MAIRRRNSSSSSTLGEDSSLLLTASRVLEINNDGGADFVVGQATTFNILEWTNANTTTTSTRNLFLLQVILRFLITLSHTSTVYTRLFWGSTCSGGCNRYFNSVVGFGHDLTVWRNTRKNSCDDADDDKHAICSPLFFVLWRIRGINVTTY